MKQSDHVIFILYYLYYYYIFILLYFSIISFQNEANREYVSEINIQ